MAKRPLRAQVVDRRYQKALGLFEKGVRAFGRKDLERARGLFDELAEDYGDYRELGERVRTYRALCQKPRRSVRPKTFEEMLNYGVVLHNRGDFGGAVKVLHQAVEMHPRHENALYCLAAAQARAGDPAALKTLRSAIHANPASRNQARRDDDFEPLRAIVEFRSLVG